MYVSSHLNLATPKYLFRLEVVLVNRLVLNLSYATNNREGTDIRTTTNFGPLTFAAGPFLGNVGGPVRSFSDTFDVDDDGHGEGTNAGVEEMPENGTSQSYVDKDKDTAANSRWNIEEIEA